MTSNAGSTPTAGATLTTAEKQSFFSTHRPQAPGASFLLYNSLSNLSIGNLHKDFILKNPEKFLCILPIDFLIPL